MRRLWAAVCVTVWPAASVAQTLDLFFVEELGGVYTQDWSGRVIGADSAGDVLVFVRGDGKSGDFYGVLSVDCDMPTQSAWVSTGGVVRVDMVPAQAIDVIRAGACGSP